MNRVKSEAEGRRNGWRAMRIDRFTGVVESLTCGGGCNAVQPGDSDEEVRHNKVAALRTSADLFGLQPADVQRVGWQAHPTMTDSELARAGLAMVGSIACGSAKANELRGSNECWSIHVSFNHGSSVGLVKVKRTAPWVEPCLTPQITREQARHSRQVLGFVPRARGRPPTARSRGVGPKDVHDARLSLISQETDAELTWRLVWDVRVFEAKSSLFIDAFTGQRVGFGGRVIE